MNWRKLQYRLEDWWDDWGDVLLDTLKSMGRLILVLLILFAIWMGFNQLMKPELQRAERWCEADEPAQALATLDSVPPQWWWHPERRARYGLLRSKALDKSYTDVRDDSLLRLAVNYYHIFGPDRYAMESLYYTGRTHQNAGRIPEAYAYFTLADRLADSLGEYHMGGLIARSISEVHAFTNNPSEELRYAEKAFDCFSRAGSTHHAEYMYFDLASALHKNDKHREAVEHYEKFIVAAQGRSDTLSLAWSQLLQAGVHLPRNEFSRAKVLLENVRRLSDYDNTVIWYTDYAIVCAHEGKIDSALYYIGKADCKAQSGMDYLRVSLRHLDVLRQYTHHKDRLPMTNLASYDSLKNIVLDHELVSYYNNISQNEIQTLSSYLKNRTRVSLILLFVILLLVAIFLIVDILQNKNRNVEIERNITQVILLQEQLTSLQSEMGSRVLRLFREHFEQIDRLGSRYFDSMGSKNEKERIYKRVQLELEEIGSPIYVEKSLEPIINECMNNLMLRVRKRMPKLHQNDLQLLTYLLLGFSSPTISVLLQIRLEATYMRISRLKNKLSLSNTREAEEILLVIC